MRLTAAQKIKVVNTMKCKLVKKSLMNIIKIYETTVLVLKQNLKRQGKLTDAHKELIVDAMKENQELNAKELVKFKQATGTNVSVSRVNTIRRSMQWKYVTDESSVELKRIHRENWPNDAEIC